MEILINKVYFTSKKHHTQNYCPKLYSCSEGGIVRIKGGRKDVFERAGGIVRIGLRDVVADLDSLADLRRRTCDVVCGLRLAELAAAAGLGSSPYVGTDQMTA